MATLRWAQVYYQEHFAGYLRQEPGGSVSFTYDEVYLESAKPSIAYTLPLQSTPHKSPLGLPAYFDNLVAEGWLEAAQTRLLGARITSRFDLLAAFGFDCIGAVSIVDPEPGALTDALLDMDDPKNLAAFASRASLSGVQPKLAIIEKKGKFYPAKNHELSTHIAKFPSPSHNDITENEFITTKVFQILLPQEEVIKPFFATIEGFSEPVLMIKRFDRNNGERIHFEEFNQILNQSSEEKYQGSYKMLSHFIRETPFCIPTENYRLFLRILAGLLVGNTDMHLKNFALFHKAEGLRLTPCYDLVAASLYDYQDIALAIAGAQLRLNNLKANNIVALGREFSLSRETIMMAVNHIEKNIAAAKENIAAETLVKASLKKKLIDRITKGWNGTFALIGKALCQKP